MYGKINNTKAYKINVFTFSINIKYASEIKYIVVSIKKKSKSQYKKKMTI